MRKFTENDIAGIARALQTFMGYRNGQDVTVKVHQGQVELALAEGITIDELLNTANYQRVNKMIPNASVEEYVDALVKNQVKVTSLSDEPGWNDPEGFPALAETFHDYYVVINPKGGSWSVTQAKLNLQKAIESNSLQGLMSEELINKVMEKTGQGKELTCYQYLTQVVKEKDIAAEIDNSLSEEQTKHRELMAQSVMETAVAEEEDDEEQNEEPVPEGMPEEDDHTLYPPDEDDAETDLHGDGTFVTIPSPKEYKRARVIDALKTLEVAEFIALAKTFNQDMSVDEMITALSDGKIDRNSETLEARNAHQMINSDLFQFYIYCAKWQGVEVNEKTATKLDLLAENWDLRDTRTRKLHKIKELVYSHTIENSEDMDLMSVVEDLEQLYSKNED